MNHISKQTNSIAYLLFIGGLLLIFSTNSFAEGENLFTETFSGADKVINLLTGAVTFLQRASLLAIVLIIIWGIVTGVRQGEVPWKQLLTGLIVAIIVAIVSEAVIQVSNVFASGG